VIIGIECAVRKFSVRDLDVLGIAHGDPSCSSSRLPAG
jgi:hypothetical protein